MACSALKADYRRILREGAGRDAHFVFLKGSRDLIRKRLKHRQGHYMKQDLLDSQFRDLEEPKDALILSIEEPPEILCRRILASMGTEQTKAEVGVQSPNLSQDQTEHYLIL